jgi:hypothetical protein
MASKGNPPSGGSDDARRADLQQVTTELQSQLESILRIAGELMALLAALRKLQDEFGDHRGGSPPPAN